MLKKGKNGVYLRPVGEVFRYKDKILEVVEVDERDHCRDCFFPVDCVLCYASYRVAGGCTRYAREDGRMVIFKEVKVNTAYAGDGMRAVGSYFTHEGKLLRVERPQSDDPNNMCEGCAFRGVSCFMERYIEVTGRCAGFGFRGEEKDIIYREVKIETDVAGNDGSTSSPQENENENENENKGGKKNA